MVVGTDDRRATPGELAEMERLLAQGLVEGAVGMSSGLTYLPGMFADPAELTTLCSVVARHSGCWSPHTRSYGRGALGSYAEAIAVAQASGCALHLTHATMNFAVNRGRAAAFLDLVDMALADGLDVTLDSYPYLPGSTTLAALLPSWNTTRGPDALIASLGDSAVRARLRREIEEVGTDGCHGCPTAWETIQVSGVRHPALAGHVGRTIAQIAVEEGRPPSEVFFGMLRDDDLATTILQHVGDEDNVRAIMRHRVHCGGSDGILVGGRPHPRSWGTFPRYLGHYVRDLGVCRGPRPPRPAHGPRRVDLRGTPHAGRGHPVGVRRGGAGDRRGRAHRSVAGPSPPSDRPGHRTPATSRAVLTSGADLGTTVRAASSERTNRVFSPFAVTRQASTFVEASRNAATTGRGRDGRHHESAERQQCVRPSER